MSKSNALENDVLALVFNATALPGAYGSNLFVSLHTGDPGEAGDQTTNEATYTGYARVTVSRDSAGWTVTGNTAVNTAAITFPQCTGGTNTITHWAVGTATSGAGRLLYKGSLTASLAVSNLITPQLLATTLQIQED
jgi:hypothetical protein